MDSPPTEPVRLVLIVGAGFSRAISPRMPMTDCLGDQVMERLGRHRLTPTPNLTDGKFETWLSRLADPQPDLSVVENIRNRASFMEISMAIHRTLVEHQAEVMREPPPWWLRQLIGLAHRADITLVSFNYDTLVECAAGASVLQDWQVGRWAHADQLVRGQPPLTPVNGFPMRDESARTFQLLKLHGSIDSYWIANDSTGATIQRWRGRTAWTPEALPPSDEEVHAKLPDRAPFIVPPAAAKSSYYQNPVTRQIWNTARQALLAATDVALVGYSLPATDLVTQGVMYDVVSETDASWTVVNPYPEPVMSRLRSIGVRPDQISVHSGNEAVKDFVQALEAPMAVAASRQLRTLDTPADPALALAMSPTHAAAVIGVSDHGNGNLFLHLDDWSVGGKATRSRQPGESRVWLLSDLRQACDATGQQEVTFWVQLGADCCRIVAVETWTEETGLSSDWLALVPSALLPLKSVRP